MVVTGIDGTPPVAATSALVELGCALHVLNEPDHHDAVDWASRVRASLPSGTRSEIARWKWVTQAIRATPFVIADRMTGDATEELDRLRATEPHEVARGLLRPISPKGDTSACMRWARSRGQDVAAHVDSLVHNPVAAVGEFVSFVERCYQDWFLDEWQRVRPRLVADARRFSDVATRLGAVEALAGLDPAIQASGRASSVTIAKVQNRRHAVDGRGLVCVPSAFIHPHIYLADAPNRPLVMVHTIDAVHREATPTVKELVRRLDAAASPGRLEVARAIATEPRTAGEIADLWSMDTTLVTRHLRTLAAAGLATPVRQGRFVQYALDRDAVARLGDELLGLLLR